MMLFQQKKGLVDVEEFWTYTKSPLPSKINKKEAELIQNLAQKAGYGIAPDIRYHHAKTNSDGKLVLFPEGHGKYFEPSKAYSEMGMALRLGAMVATIDSHVDRAEGLFSIFNESSTNEASVPCSSNELSLPPQ